MKVNILQIGKEVLKNEAGAVLVIAKQLDRSFVEVVELMYHTKGKIIITGIGKSGIVARKIAATLSSTGTFSLFVHPVEALHGDLGMVDKNDIIIVISHSGETQELVNFVQIVKKVGNKIIVFTAHKDSLLGGSADIVLETHVREEACKICATFNLAPTTSALVELALGDAVASALQEFKGFKREHFAQIHPAGELGKALK